MTQLFDLAAVATTSPKELKTQTLSVNPLENGLGVEAWMCGCVGYSHTYMYNYEKLLED